MARSTKTTPSKTTKKAPTVKVAVPKASALVLDAITRAQIIGANLHTLADLLSSGYNSPALKEEVEASIRTMAEVRREICPIAEPKLEVTTGSEKKTVLAPVTPLFPNGPVTTPPSPSAA